MKYTYTTTYEPITKNTKTRRSGKLIQCPICKEVSRVYHLSWSTLTCTHCSTAVDKYDWKVEQTSRKLNKRPLN